MEALVQDGFCKLSKAVKETTHLVAEDQNKKAFKTSTGEVDSNVVLLRLLQSMNERMSAIEAAAEKQGDNRGIVVTVAESRMTGGMQSLT